MKSIASSKLAEDFDFRVESTPRLSSYDPRTVYRLQRSMHRHHADLIHVSGLQSEGFCAALAARLCPPARVLLCVHGSSVDLKHVSWLRRTAVHLVLEPLTLLMVNGVYTVCHHRQQQPTIRWFARSNIGVLHNAVESTSSVTGDVRSQVCLGPGPLAICVSRLSREKGLLVLAAALDLLEQQGQRFPRVIIVGDGPDWRAVEIAFRSHISSGRAVFLGRRDDISSLLSLADFFVLPSLYENLSMAILEAMHAGLAVIASNAGGNPEVVAHEQTGLLFRPNDPASLAKALVTLTESPALRLRMGEAGRLRALSEFNHAKYLERLKSIYQSLLATNRTLPAAHV